MKVLVTGASGFVGREALEALIFRGYEVHGLARSSPRPEIRGVVWHEADLLQPGAATSIMKRIVPTHLLHLAWYSQPGKFWHAFENLSWVKATLDLIDAFRETGGKRFVGVGTCAEYDWSLGTCTEGVTALEPATLYGTCKLAAGTILCAYAPLGTFSAAWGRLFFLYGPREPREKLVASTITALLRGEVARSTSGEQVRDFLHVRDCAEALVALLGSDVDGPVNIASGTGIAVREIVREIGGLLHASDRIASGAIIPARPEAPRVVANTRRLNELVGWSPRITLRDGLSETINWYRDHLRAES